MPPNRLAPESQLTAAPMSPEDRGRIATLLRGTDPELAAKYERDARDREQGLDMARAMLTESHVVAFSKQFGDSMAQFRELAEKMAEALRLNAEARKQEADNERAKFASVWGPKGSVIAILTVILTNLATIVGTLYAAGSLTDGPPRPPPAAIAPATSAPAPQEP